MAETKEAGETNNGHEFFQNILNTGKRVEGFRQKGRGFQAKGSRVSAGQHYKSANTNEEIPLRPFSCRAYKTIPDRNHMTDRGLTNRMYPSGLRRKIPQYRVIEGESYNRR